MSAQFGKYNFDGRPVHPQELDRARPLLAPFGPDSEGYICKDNVAILYRAFHTTKESRREAQPYVSPSGAIVTWDGRLDNREELIGKLRCGLSTDSTDLTIVAAAYEHWGTDAFARLIGEWAVSICDPSRRYLVFAKDFVGTRHLYYSVEKDEVTWCTILDPLVLLPGRSCVLDEEYIAGWLSLFPAAHLTPYAGIHSVVPSSFVRLAKGRQKVSRYWDFDSVKSIRYRTDGEYEDHFRSVLLQAVRRRLRSDSPVLAELSGGMDSSSIVCMADAIIAGGTAGLPRLDTLSYYNDSEPNWNERPYFAKVEEKRGRTGHHIDVGSEENVNLKLEGGKFAPTPGCGGPPKNLSRQFAECLASQGNRVVLSGIGGDEVLGGVPTPIPELADLLVRADLRRLANRLKVWSLNKRKPWFHLLSETVRSFLPPALAGFPNEMRPATWLHSAFVKRHRAALTGYTTRLHVFGPLPSFQANLSTLEVLRRQLGDSALSSEPIYEKRYPLLDRCLLEFAYAIPREQLVRPGQRRSLMRRALVGMVPQQILDRKRKAYISRSPLAAFVRAWPRLVEMSEQMASSSLQIVAARAFREAAQEARTGKDFPCVAMMRTLAVERWLRHLGDQHLMQLPFPTPDAESRASEEARVCP
jgi:asparagine synthase (glutamine-hydrolysing)